MPAPKQSEKMNTALVRAYKNKAPFWESYYHYDENGYGTWRCKLCMVREEFLANNPGKGWNWYKKPKMEIKDIDYADDTHYYKYTNNSVIWSCIKCQEYWYKKGDRKKVE